MYDLTDKNTAYFIQVMQENNNNICGRFTADQLITPVHSDRSAWKKWAIAALLFIGFGPFMQKASAQQGKTRQTPQQKNNNQDEHPMMMGDIVTVVDPVNQALSNALIKDCKVPANTNGRLIVTFTLKKDGTMNNIALTKYLSKAVNEEVLRVIKRVPLHKFMDKEVYHYSHTLYLDFQKGKVYINI